MTKMAELCRDERLGEGEMEGETQAGKIKVMEKQGRSPGFQT
jgi:hypothetical protein